MTDQIKVLFICTANACRSQMAEALLRHLDPVRFLAFSAGSHPTGYVHPVATATMEALGVSMTGQRSKSWDEFEHQAVDLVITVCGSAAGETCPVWPNAPVTVNWPLPDPVAQTGTEDERLEFAVSIAKRVQDRLKQLIKLDFASLSRGELIEQLERMNEM